MKKAIAFLDAGRLEATTVVCLSFLPPRFILDFLLPLLIPMLPLVAELVGWSKVVSLSKSLIESFSDLGYCICLFTIIIEQRSVEMTKCQTYSSLASMFHNSLPPDDHINCFFQDCIPLLAPWPLVMRSMKYIGINHSLHFQGGSSPHIGTKTRKHREARIQKRKKKLPIWIMPTFIPWSLPLCILFN